MSRLPSSTSMAVAQSTSHSIARISRPILVFMLSTSLGSIIDHQGPYRHHVRPPRQTGSVTVSSKVHSPGEHLAGEAAAEWLGVCR